MTNDRPIRHSRIHVCFPVLILPLLGLAGRTSLPPWGLMWALSFGIYFGLKWVTWSMANSSATHPAWRSVAYLLAWPGMDARAFLDPTETMSAPTKTAWLWASSKTLLGAALLWVVARHLTAKLPLVRGWIGMLGLILFLHFGTFQLLALLWQGLGIRAEAIMRAPLRSTSLTEFWGKRWNLGFREPAHKLVFRPLHRRLGAGLAGFLVFVMSGLIHDLVISVPARGGYGLPTLYFVLQGVGVSTERSRGGKRLGLGRGVRGWCFTMLFLVVPVFLLFHPWFVMRVILPFMRAIRAL